VKERNDEQARAKQARLLSEWSNPQVVEVKRSAA
jgi:hypothetical protein